MQGEHPHMASWSFSLISAWPNFRGNQTWLQWGLDSAKIKVASTTCPEAAIDTQRVRESAQGLLS